MNQESREIIKFEGAFKSFSNFHPCTVYFEGRNYPTTEHAYVAAKTTDEMFREMMSKIPAKDAGKAKKLGRNKKKCKLRQNWDILKIGIMKRLLMTKI